LLSTQQSGCQGRDRLWTAER